MLLGKKSILKLLAITLSSYLLIGLLFQNVVMESKSVLFPISRNELENSSLKYEHYLHADHRPVCYHPNQGVCMCGGEDQSRGNVHASLLVLNKVNICPQDKNNKRQSMDILPD